MDYLFIYLFIELTIQQFVMTCCFKLQEKFLSLERGDCKGQPPNVFPARVVISRIFVYPGN